MAQGGRSWQLIAAVVVLVAAAALLVWRMGQRPEPEAALAGWVCDRCGAEVARPFDSTSPDCPKCDHGQLVQRVLFRCKKCGTAFDAYQMCWSPRAARAEAKRAEADADPARRPLDPDAPAVLVRHPGGTWAWTGSRAGLDIMRKLRCPTCGEGPREQFEKQLRGKQDASGN